MLSGAERPGRSPISTTAMSARNARAISSPIATRPWRTTTSGVIRHPASRGSAASSSGRACASTARADKPSAITIATSWPLPACCEPRFGVAGEAAAEIGAHEVMRAVGGGARDREHGQAQRRKLFDEARLVELRVHGVAGARVGEAEIKLWGSGERCAGARQRDARGGQRAQLRPRLILRRYWRRVCWRAVVGHGLGKREFKRTGI